MLEGCGGEEAPTLTPPARAPLARRLALHAAHEARRVLARQHRVLSSRLLPTPPPRVAEDVDVGSPQREAVVETAVEPTVDRARLEARGAPDGAEERAVEGGAEAYHLREGGGGLQVAGGRWQVAGWRAEAYPPAGRRWPSRRERRRASPPTTLRRWERARAVRRPKARMRAAGSVERRTVVLWKAQPRHRQGLVREEAKLLLRLETFDQSARARTCG